MNPTVCKHLRTKSMYILETPEDALADKTDAIHASPCHFWCNLSQSAVGMDDRPAHKNTCNPSRSCYEE